MHVVIADDHALMRQGLILLMRDPHPDWIFGEAASLDEVLAAFGRAPVDLLLMDLRMPGMAGGQSLHALRESHPRTRVAVLTATEDRATILECLAAGVHGYILKSATAAHMLAAIETLLEGGVYVPPMLAHLIAAAGPRPAAEGGFHGGDAPGGDGRGNGGSVRMAGMTPRQTDVLNLLAEGLSTKDIARRLDLGLGTVKVHLAGVYRALNASNRMEAVVRAGRLKAGG
jgi:DNA-binding NarL/FixJ family response regulator